MLKSELKRVGPNGRALLIKTWEPHLSSLLKDFDDLNQLNVQQSLNQQHSPQQQQLIQSQISSTSSMSSTASTDPKQLQEQSPPDAVSSITNSNRIRRKQFVAIIILSLIGAEFGQDINTNKNQTIHKTIPQGFSLEDHSILKRISE